MYRESMQGVVQCHILTRSETGGAAHREHAHRRGDGKYHRDRALPATTTPKKCPCPKERRPTSTAPEWVF